MLYVHLIWMDQTNGLDKTAGAPNEISLSFVGWLGPAAGDWVFGLELVSDRSAWRKGFSTDPTDVFSSVVYFFIFFFFSFALQSESAPCSAPAECCKTLQPIFGAKRDSFDTIFAHPECQWWTRSHYCQRTLPDTILKFAVFFFFFFLFYYFLASLFCSCSGSLNLLLTR